MHLPRLGGPTGFTLVEMLVAMAITLVMMGAVVTLFANISNSVRNRRATIEMSSQLRHVRNVLQQDLQGATCPGITWQKPESNHGYIEIIEGQYREGNSSQLIDDIDQPGNPQFNPEIDHKTSLLPSSNLPFTTAHPDWATDGGGLGDYDDVLMLTVRNEHEPFVGRVPKSHSDDPQEQPFCVRPDNKQANKFDKWTLTDTINSQLAEVVWFAFENPADSELPSGAGGFFGEPGMRTIYRRTLLIAPWLNPYRHMDSNGLISDTFSYDGGTFKAEPGLVRILPRGNQLPLEDAIAAVIAFQDRYDLSVRLEWDQNIQRWKIMANTLGDLTKRENRFGHFGYMPGSGSSNPSKRIFPFPLVSMGSDYSGSTQPVSFGIDPEIGAPSNANAAKATANLQDLGTLKRLVVSYTVDTAGLGYNARPFAYIGTAPTPPSGVPASAATAQAILNDNGSVVRVIHGPVPLWGTRRGEDVMMTDALAFDLRVYDPGAPMFATKKANGDLDVVLTPSDPGWLDAYMGIDNMQANGSGSIGSRNANSSVIYPYVGQGAYVDLGYGYNTRFNPPGLPAPVYKSPEFSTSASPWFFTPRGLSDIYGNLLAPGYAVYDTWSFHYENDGVDEDGPWAPANQQWRKIIDQGVDGLDNDGTLGVDDVGERETTPPYDKPLRGMQVLIRTYERDSRSIRQVRVNQHFMPE